MKRYFVAPPADFYRSEKPSTCENIYRCNWQSEEERAQMSTEQAGETYAEANYLGGGIATRIKAQHFEIALRLARPYFGDSHAIDLGCADGVFIPSLAKHFESVCAVEQHEPFARLSEKLVSALELENATVLCNAGKSFAELKAQIPPRDYRVMFLLEVMEHVGERESLYESKLRFLREAFTLLTDDGVVVMSVPKMVGLSFLAQRMGFAVLGISREPISMGNLLKAAILGDTSELEKEWRNNGHLGFNHRKLEARLEGSEFRIARKKSLMFQNVYLVDRI